MDLPLTPASETKQINIRPQKQIEVIRAIGFLKRHEATTTDELFPTFYKDSGDVNKTPGANLGRRDF